jgi:hypothetical protein
MRVLTRKEENLIKLAIFESNENLMDRVWQDFKINPQKLFNSQQQSKMQEVFEVLYTTLCDTIEDNANLQPEHDK